MTKESKKELNPRVKAISEKMKNHLVEEDGKLKINSAYLKEVFSEECLKEGSTLSLKQFKETKDHEEAILASAKYVLASKSYEMLKENSDLERVYGDAKIHHDKYSITTYRERLFHNPVSKENVLKKGHVQPVYHKRGSKKSGYTNAVNVELIELSENYLD